MNENLSAKVYVKKNGVYEEIPGDVSHITKALNKREGEITKVSFSSLLEQLPPLSEVRIDYLKGETVYKREFFVTTDNVKPN